MMWWIGQWLFPRERPSARRRKMQVLGITILGALVASALTALAFYWAYYSGRF